MRISSKPLTGRGVLGMLLGFFAVVIGVNLTMMNFAITTLPGTEVDSAYSASLGYEKEIAAAHDQSERNWQVAAHLTRDAGGEALLLVEAHDVEGKPVSGLKFQGRLERPTDKRADRAIALAEAGTGIYRGRLEDLAPGQWDLVLQGDAGEARVFLSRNRVLLK